MSLPTGRSTSGSSPLARGLQGDEFAHDVEGRIIPARAGFTPRPPSRSTRDPDHPRSRGVYTSKAYTMALKTGSSPLARGLRGPHRVGEDVGRIIPARAGFTTGTSTGPVSPRDHPRSRGVYSRAGPLTGPCRGSSPLARGLHHRRRVQGPDRRIIPARAGFTGPPGHRAVRRRDHPRSRGVYTGCGTGSWPAPGSSPLARGLPETRLVSYSAHGIIPARAGFTTGGAWRASRRADHPRSRGVYVVDTSWPVVPAGSSPLARGLHHHRPDPVPPGRIIPARAGFTNAGLQAGRQDRDHPRSRGVYRVVIRPDAYALWIIPARAGFTRPTRCNSGRRRDHPRSRGVYRELTTVLEAVAGSSPLARGLRMMTDAQARDRRIIPARAGFTIVVRAGLDPVADHPRSRGVYGPPETPPMRRTGSSPLARGLHQQITDPDGHNRIIPARAGFTSTTAGRSARARDHPRSRGVYPRSPHGVEVGGGIIPARAGFTHAVQRVHGLSRDHPRSRGVYSIRGRRMRESVGSSPLARGLRRPKLSPYPHPRIIPARAGFTSRRLHE